MHALMCEVLHRRVRVRVSGLAFVCMYPEHTYSQCTEFFFHEEQDLTATPAEKQIERVRREEK